MDVEKEKKEDDIDIRASLFVRRGCRKNGRTMVNLRELS